MAKTFVFHAINLHGPINSLCGIADAVSRRGHRVIFVCDSLRDDIAYPIISIDQRLRQEIVKGRFDAACCPDNESVDGNDASDDRWATKMDNIILGPSNAAEQLSSLSRTFVEELVAKLGAHDDTLKIILDEIKPDVIVTDHGGIIPAFMASDSPHKWVVNYSCQPLLLYRDNFRDRFPSPCLGVSPKASREVTEASWKTYEENALKYIRPMMREAAIKAKIVGCPHESIIYPSPYMNIYLFPACLDYEEEAGGPLPNWLRLDSCVRHVEGTFEIPEKLANRGGKLVFVSMGTLTSSNLSLMRRLVKVLAKSPHRFIVAKGIRHNEYELADNMWGDKFVKQTLVLPIVDGIITHGGNNTITEALHFGVPSIVVTPMFWDQLDNAVRIQDKGLGYNLDIMTASDEVILETVDKSLNDEESMNRVKLASRDIQRANGPLRAAVALEELANKAVNQLIPTRM